MEKVEIIGTKNYTKIFAVDEKGEGGANHHYLVEQITDTETKQFADVLFQKGPIKVHGINGCCDEDLIAIVIHRLQGFQKGEFSCRENAIAITKLEEALLWLNKRTAERIRRGVEGTHIK